MKRLEIRNIAVLAAGLLTALPVSALAQNKNSINVTVAGAAAADTTASAFLLEYERLITPKLSVLGRGTFLKYKYDDSVYVEDGKGTGIGLGVRFYPSGQGMKGFYVGGVIGTFASKWDFTDDKGTAAQTQGEGDSFGEVGYRFLLGQHVTLTPAFNFGSWIGGDSNCDYTAPPSRVGTTCDKESELGFYGTISLSLGIAF
jgi:hypothetical protein